MNVEQYIQWENEHSVSIPANECYEADVHILVDPHRFGGPDGRIRVDMTALDPETQRGIEHNSTAYLTAAETQRLIDLLLAAIEEGQQK